MSPWHGGGVGSRLSVIRLKGLQLMRGGRNLFATNGKVACERHALRSTGSSRPEMIGGLCHLLQSDYTIILGLPT
jgi:hypothetical protein